MRINARVKAKAKLNKIKKIGTADYSIHTTAPPDKGKANHAVIKLLSQELNIPKSKFIILKGQKSKNKIIQVNY